MKKEMICIVCPVGCHLEIDDNLKVTGNQCKRGEIYAKEEMTNPTRILTTTVAIKSVLTRRLSVKSERPLPKGKLPQAMEILNNIILKAPISLHEIVVENIANTGVNMISTRHIPS